LLGNRANINAKDDNKETEEQQYGSKQKLEDTVANEKRENPAHYLIETREALTKAMERSLQNENPSTRKKFDSTKGIDDSACSIKGLVSLSLSQTASV
jgi:chromatin segregation and condensation protein Rec8/ScpA/Scc1 (kleisin family)